MKAINEGMNPAKNMKGTATEKMPGSLLTDGFMRTDVPIAATSALAMPTDHNAQNL
jgi:hypothetical protein